MHAYDIVRAFEKRIAEYTGCPFAIAIDNCSNALFLCCYYLKVKTVVLPKRTHPIVPSAVVHAGGLVTFVDLQWEGSYQLTPYPIIDSACQFKRNMYVPQTFLCVSFNYTKPIKIGKGGMILTDNKDACKWFKLARYCGMHENPCQFSNCDCNNEYRVEFPGWNMYMTPEDAARGLCLTNKMEDEYPITNINYPDLSELKIYEDE